jgi:hypothetical protein
MTRHGSLAYYLAAWICGCFFMVLGFWVDVHWLRGTRSQGAFLDVGLLAICFFGFILGAVPSLLFAWMLRRLMSLFSTEQFWCWISSGAGLALLLVWLLGSLGHLLRDPKFLPYSALPIWPFLVVGPVLLLEAGIWMALPVGAATAGVLFAVHRAFAHIDGV